VSGGISHNSDGVVVEDGGDIFRGELVRGITNEQTCLADGTVTDDDAPAGDGVSIRAQCAAGAGPDGARTLLWRPPWLGGCMWAAGVREIGRRAVSRVGRACWIVGAGVRDAEIKLSGS
jgi:hypothetical protein